MEETRATGPKAVTAQSPRREAESRVSSQQPTETRIEAGAEAAAAPDGGGTTSTGASSSAAVVAVRDPSSGRSRGGRALAWVAGLSALGVAAYFAFGYFQRFQPSDAARRSLSTEQAKDQAIPAAPGKPITAQTAAASPDASKPAAGSAQPAPTAGREGSTSGETRPTVGNGAGGRGGRGTTEATAGAPERQPPTDIFLAKPEPKAGTAGPQAEARRATTGDRAASAQRLPATEACTDGLAALGLCTQNNTRGRKPQ